MADFRKAKYSGSVNLAPECGPVLIELDTEAKTATASLEDPASQYTLAGGGGGGLEYVTVTLSMLGDGQIYGFFNNEDMPMPEGFPKGLMGSLFNRNSAPENDFKVPKGSIWSTNFNTLNPRPTITTTGDIQTLNNGAMIVINGNGTITTTSSGDI